jgi:hypothetical protein
MDSNNKTTLRRRNAGAIMFFAAICLSLGAGAVSSAYQSGLLVGHVVGLIGLLWVISLAFTRKNTVGRSYVVLALGLAALIWGASSMFNMYGQRQDFEAAVENLKTAATGAPAASRARTVRIPLPEDDYERNEDANIGLINEVADAVRSRFHEFQQVASQIAAVQLEGVLAPTNLVTAQGIAESRAKIATYAQLQHQLTELSAAAKPQVQAIIDRSNATQYMKGQVWAGFNESYPQQLAQMQALESVRQETLQTISGLLNLAESSRGQLQAKDGKLLFADALSLQQYQIGMAQLARQASREDQITAALQAQAQQGVSRITAAGFRQ